MSPFLAIEPFGEDGSDDTTSTLQRGIEWFLHVPTPVNFKSNSSVVTSFPLSVMVPKDNVTSSPLACN